MSVIIIGAGHGGYQCAVSLRSEGYQESIALISEEAFLPYHRPPLSKAYLKGEQDADALLFRPAEFYENNRIDLHLDTRVVALDPQARTIRLANGEVLSFTRLVLATGARPRALPVAGADLRGVCDLRDRAQADAIRARLDAAEDVVIIGAGFIGLEIAATAALLGKRVSVVEVQDRVMARVMLPVMSAYFTGLHERHGVTFIFETGVSGIIGDHGAVQAVRCTDGTSLAADLVIAGIGVVPNEELARDAQIACEDGILVDTHMQTSARDIYAIGDVARHPNVYGGGLMRLESVQNALDQGRCAAANICGRKTAYDAVPWFWSDQYDIKLQMVGLSADHDTAVVRGDTAADTFSVCYYRDDRLIGIDSVNAPADHVAGRHLLAKNISPPPDAIADAQVRLKTFLKA